MYAVGPGYASPGYYPSPTDYERTKQVDRTKTGVLLLMIGALIGWLPFGIGLIGGLLALIGAILVILGRKAFGEKHSRDVVVAVVVFIIGIVASIVVGVVFAFSILPSAFTGAVPSAATLQGAVDTLLIGGIVAAAIGGVAQVLFTYEIQDQLGRYLLFAGFGASLALQVVIYFLIAPLIDAAIASALSGGTLNSTPLLNLQSQANNYALLGAIADLLWAGAYYLVWSRINRGEIPKPLAGPGAPPMPPPYMGMPPQMPPQVPPQAPPPSGPTPPVNPQ